MQWMKFDSIRQCKPWDKAIYMATYMYTYWYDVQLKFKGSMHYQICLQKIILIPSGERSNALKSTGGGIVESTIISIHILLLRIHLPVANGNNEFLHSPFHVSKLNDGPQVNIKKSQSVQMRLCEFLYIGILST